MTAALGVTLAIVDGEGWADDDGDAELVGI